MKGGDVCLTDCFNRFHDRSEPSSDVQELRDVHLELDNAVAAAYAWCELDLGHGFHETKQGIRFTISESARREVLARLLKLNHERYAEEVARDCTRKRAEAGGRRVKKPAARARRSGNGARTAGTLRCCLRALSSR